jgi:hypothetical protein
MRSIILVFATVCIALLLTFYTTICFGEAKFDKKFLTSTIGTSGTTVEEFIEIIHNARLSNGKHPTILGWSRNDNIYTLKVRTTTDLKFTFEHLLNYNGEASSLYVTINGKPVDALLTLMTIVSMPRDQTKFDKVQQKIQQAQQKEFAFREQEFQKKFKKETKEAQLKEEQERQNEIAAYNKQLKEAQLKEEQERQNEITAINLQKADDEAESKIFRQKAIDDEYNRKSQLLHSMNGSLIWTDNKPYSDMQKFIDINIKSDSTADVSFISECKGNIICKIVDNNAKINFEESTIIASEGDCSIKIEPMSNLVTLHYRGKCAKQCSPSNAYQESYAFPTGYYVLKKASEDATVRERIRQENSWK